MKLTYAAVKKMLQKDDIDAIRFYGKEVIGCLARALEEPNMHIRANAAEALGETEDPAAIPALIKALGDKSKCVRETAIEALVYMDNLAVPALLKALGNKNAVIRKGAAEALAAINNPAVISLVNALGSGEKHGRRKAALPPGAADGELLKGETVKPPKNKANKNKKVSAPISKHGYRSRIV